MTKLTVYKASAGSGKTYALTQNYINLLFRDEKAYHRILAVTFTNKAASEMKHRILNTLYKLSMYTPGMIPKPDFLDFLCQNHSKSEKEISLMAGKILKNILNDYSRFSVGTIDRFFQSVIRAFAREIGMQAGYNLELNTDKILSEAADNLIYSIDDNLQIREWMIQFAEEEILNGKKVDLKPELLKLGGELFKEKYRELVSEFGADQITPAQIREFHKSMRMLVDRFTSHLKKLANQAFGIIASHSLEVDDFSGKKNGVLNFFIRINNAGRHETDKYIPKTNSRKALDDPSAWYTKTTDLKDRILAAYHGGLNELLREAIQYSDVHSRHYITANEILKNTYAFGILSELSVCIRELTHDRNIFLLSDSSSFLNEIIEDNDAPFIFEKAGNFYQHFMLDEFQDTSISQWQNFKPLIRNGLATNDESLLVGDVKQSIYRWRNSDWKILARGIEEPFRGRFETVPLDYNYRSSRSVVELINSVFTDAPEILAREFLRRAAEEGQEGIQQDLAQLILSAYSGAAQKFPETGKTHPGYVRLNVLEPGMNQTDYLQKITTLLPEMISGLQKRGYRARDIAVLVRKADEGKKIASILLENKNNPDSASGSDTNFNVVSNDSLLVSSHPAIGLIIALLLELRLPGDRINEAFIKYEYFTYLSRKDHEPVDYHSFFTGSEQDIPGSFMSRFQNFTREYRSLRNLSLYEMVESICRIFDLNQSPSNIPYLQAFQDIVLSYMKKESSDINGFLDYWEENSHRHKLNLSEEQDAIRIFTIHKAKGLEFKVVIIPFLKWHLDHPTSGRNREFIWCKNGEEPFNAVPYIPLLYSSALKNTLYSNVYFEEMFHAFVDNMNLAYVAMTRAREELYLLTSPSNKLDTAGDLVYEAVMAGISGDRLSPEKTRLIPGDLIEYGERPANIAETGTAGMNHQLLETYPINPYPGRLKVKFRNESFFTARGDIHNKIDYGNIMHTILAGIENRSDLESAVRDAFRNGILDREQMGDVHRSLASVLDTPGTAEILFEPGWKVFNERTILCDQHEYRPDRVMIREKSARIIDYKSGDQQLSSHRSQIRNYMKLLQKIGYHKVEGFLWYITTGKWEEVQRET